MNNYGNVGNEPRARNPRPGRDPEVPVEKFELGFATRLRFLSMAELEAARAARYGLSLSLALFVLEDRETLCALPEQDLERCDWEIGTRLAAGIRQGPDVLARFTLGEWALLLPHTGLDGAVSVAQRCLERVSTAEMRIGATPFHVAVSAGVAAHEPVRRYGVDTVSLLLHTAERAQRQSSALGGGRAVGCKCGAVSALGPGD